MDEDNPNDDNNKSSTSKKEGQKNASQHDLRIFDEEMDDQASNSKSSASGSYSVSRVDTAEDNVKPDVKQLGRPRRPAKKKRVRGRRNGQVAKRRKSVTRRQTARTSIRRKPRAKGARLRMASAYTIFSRPSHHSGCDSSTCKYCGHRCCLRRWEYEEKRHQLSRRRYTGKRIKKLQGVRKKRTLKKDFKKLISESIQAGSRSEMFSPLFINSNNPAAMELPQEKPYCKISPEMIYQSLRRLSMWRQNVSTEAILNYIKTHYPVNRTGKQLLTELKEKLRIACIVGIVMCPEENCWRLSCALMSSKLTKTHVTRFWQVYGDTLQPVSKKQVIQKAYKRKKDNETSILLGIVDSDNKNRETDDTAEII